MTDPERDMNRQRATSDLSRARKRKLQREGGSSASSEVNSGARWRASTRSGPTIRERQVTSQLREKSASTSLIRKAASIGNKSGSTKPRRKAESRRSETLYEATPRAETQRITSADGGYLPKKNRRIFDARSEAAPPVMVRGGMGGMAFGRVATSRLHKQRTPRRRIDVPLSVTGAELRLPSIPFLHLSWRTISLLMVLMLSASLLLMWKAPLFQVDSVQAEGLQRLTVEDLNAVMRTYGKSVFTLNPNILKKDLQLAFPEFSKISVRVGLPASVKVVVTEREPIISWIQDGVETWVDAQGISFPPRGVPESPLMRVEGYGTQPGAGAEASQEDTQSISGAILPTASNAPTLRLSPELVTSILDLGAKMPADTVLVYDSAHGLGWNDPNGWEVFFGPEDKDMAMKLVVYQALVERLKSEGIQPAMISVEYVHAPYYRTVR